MSLLQNRPTIRIYGRFNTYYKYESSWPNDRNHYNDADELDWMRIVNVL